ncbi:MAG: DNA polymerase III subunit delta' [Parvibaculales bacterium]|jgi:DNA polymerase-3 subunit delta'|nr:DNA polymerase III subunit delta' [Alphaproteobacteria bacterium]
MSTAETIEELPDIDGDNPPRLTRILTGHAKPQADFLAALNGGRMPHAWLLTGPKGVGKASFAYLAARLVLSGGSATAMSPALESDDAHLVEEGAHPDLFVLKRDYNPKTQKFRGDIPAEAARDLRQSFNLSAGRGGWRVAIIDSIDELNRYGVNALLKLIEEPPEKCLFLIICHNPGRLLDTIRSRCRMLSFNALDESDLQSIVHGRLEGSDPNEVAASAFLAQGSAGYALMLSEEGGFDLYREMIGVLETAPQLDVEKLHGLAGRFGARAAPEQFAIFCFLLSGWLHRYVRFASTGAGFQPVFEGEEALVNRLLGDGLGVEPFVALWEKVEQDSRAVEALNLDKKQAVLEWMTGFADASRKRAV